MKIVKGDRVLIIAGKERNKEGIVERVLPKKDLVVVAGRNIVKKHMKRTAKLPQGGIVELFAPIHVSNVVLLDPRNNKPTRKRSDVPKPTKSLSFEKGTVKDKE